MQTDITSQNIAAFFHTGHPTKFSKKELVWGANTLSHGIYYIDTGYVKEYSITDEGDEVVHIIYKHGEIFPLTWAYLGVDQDVYFETLSETLTWHVSREHFTLFAQDNVRVGFALASQLAMQFGLYSKRIDNLQLKTSRERVIHRLLVLAERFGESQGSSVRINLPVSHDLIASSINLARESVSREMEKLEQEKMIKRHNRLIVINDPIALNSLLVTPMELDLDTESIASKYVVSHMPTHTMTN